MHWEMRQKPSFITIILLLWDVWKLDQTEILSIVYNMASQKDMLLWVKWGVAQIVYWSRLH